MKAQTKKTISHDDIQRALKKFQQRGGLITKLDDQFIPARKLVGAKFGLYEPVMETTEATAAVSNDQQ